MPNLPYTNTLQIKAHHNENQVTFPLMSELHQHPLSRFSVHQEKNQRNISPKQSKRSDMCSMSSSDTDSGQLLKVSGGHRKNKNKNSKLMYMYNQIHKVIQ